MYVASSLEALVTHFDCEGCYFLSILAQKLYQVSLQAGGVLSLCAWARLCGTHISKITIPFETCSCVTTWSFHLGPRFSRLNFENAVS